MPKKQWIKDIRAGDEVKSVFLITNVIQGQDRNGRSYWKLEIKDKTGSLEARIWYPQSQTYTPENNRLVYISSGRASSYQNQLQVTINVLQVLDDDTQIDLSAFVAASSRPSADMLAEIEELCSHELFYKPWLDFALTVLHDPQVRSGFLTSPGAKMIHHAWAGGLVEHTLSVAKLCLAFCDYYPELDRQILLVAAIFHDIGKIWEYSGGLNTDYTDMGRLLGHIDLGLEYLAPYLEKAEQLGLDPALSLHFRHMIISHHGTHEFGSPCLPQTAEAFALHFADNLDAKLTQIRTIYKDQMQPDGTWSQYQKSLERILYHPVHTPSNSAGEDFSECSQSSLR